MVQKGELGDGSMVQVNNGMNKIGIKQNVNRESVLRFRFLWLLLLLGVVVAFCCFLLTHAMYPTPEWVDWQEKEFVWSCGSGLGTTDDQDNEDCVTENRPKFDDYRISLTDKKLIITSADGAVIWKSDDDIFFQDILVTDIDRDGAENRSLVQEGETENRPLVQKNETENRPLVQKSVEGEIEIIALVWKRGKYGVYRPFWEKGNNTDDNSYSQHIFIYDIEKDGTLKPKWFTSEIGSDIRRFKTMDWNDSIILTETVDDRNSLWIWQSFGLKNIDNELKFIAFGDNIIHSEIIECANLRHAGKYDFLYESFADEIESADIAALQVESMLVDKKGAVSGYPFFGSPLEVGQAIADVGFDIAVCGGNHSLDRGSYGIDVTTSFFADKGITCVGVQGNDDEDYRPYEIIEKKKMRIAVFDYTYGVNDVRGDNALGDDAQGDEARRQDTKGLSVSSRNSMVHLLPRTSAEEKELVEDLKKCRQEADFVIVFVHWGDEFETEITEEQRHFASLFAEGGVDVVIGTHPHVVQDVETIVRPDGGEMVVFYSLGNFRAYQGSSTGNNASDKSGKDTSGVSDEMNAVDTKTGTEAVLYLEHTYDGVRLKKYEKKEVDAFVFVK